MCVLHVGSDCAAFTFACLCKRPYFSSITPTNQLYYARNVDSLSRARAPGDPKGQSSSHQFIYSNLDYIHPLFSFMIGLGGRE